MNEPKSYRPSQLANGQQGWMRERTFTRWLSQDMRQAAVDFCKNLGLVPLYSETEAGGRTRYLFWKLPEGAALEVRSGRDEEAFLALDRSNAGDSRRLLSLHISEEGSHSAVWITPGNYQDGVAALAGYGISPAEMVPGGVGKG